MGQTMQMNRGSLAVALRSLGFGTVASTVGTLGLAPSEEPLDGSRPISHAATLIDAHACWTGEAPAGRRDELPGHVVVTVDGTTRYAGQRMAGRALDQLFGDVDHGLTVHAFCR